MSPIEPPPRLLSTLTIPFNTIIPGSVSSVPTAKIVVDVVVPVAFAKDHLNPETSLP